MKKNELKDIIKEALREVIKEEFSLTITPKISDNTTNQLSEVNEKLNLGKFRENFRNIQENQMPPTAIEGSSLPPGEIDLDTIAKLMKS